MPICIVQRLNDIAVLNESSQSYWVLPAIVVSHSVTCHQTQVNITCHKPSQRPVLDLPNPEGRKAELA